MHSNSNVLEMTQRLDVTNYLIVLSMSGTYNPIYIVRRESEARGRYIKEESALYHLNVLSYVSTFLYNHGITYMCS